MLTPPKDTNVHSTVSKVGNCDFDSNCIFRQCEQCELAHYTRVFAHKTRNQDPSLQKMGEDTEKNIIFIQQCSHSTRRRGVGINEAIDINRDLNYQVTAFTSVNIAYVAGEISSFQALQIDNRW